MRKAYGRGRTRRSCTRASVSSTSSPAGAQPMANEDETIWTVFNGEIYNHREIRRELEARGRKQRAFHTEVLPHLYEEEGPEFVKNCAACSRWPSTISAQTCFWLAIRFDQTAILRAKRQSTRIRQ